ncbi:protein-export chaperone SecB [Tissierella sp. MSJ-40]|uniref:Protein-export chaperone SecB n=1 Tax=Tissierella simiarum TaxID=2841534 RepID=A0ABS6E4E8_9FIRM|nr:protein-export chaperone SecB [Tissierella simiarum]MBU5437776.1 protein-export chaperone SecB [Tissierella simiarum]
MINAGQATSTLALYDILVDSVEFKMNEGCKYLDEENLRLGFDSKTYESEDGTSYKITTTTVVNDKENRDINIKLVMSGYFGFRDEGELSEEQRDHFIEKNTLAIIFPYIRSYITNLTAQSGGKPIIIPPININMLLEDAPEEEEDQ